MAEIMTLLEDRCKDLNQFAVLCNICRIFKFVTHALECLKKFEALNVEGKIKRIAELEAQLKTASTKLGSTQVNLKKAGSASGARLQILEIYADDKLKSGQKSEACTLFRAIIMMNPDKAELLKKNGC